ncbi:AAA family ATPase [Thalassotalea profundi]|uniref:AAA family ATPase n=1 Tax=Thalassotalea profundi TaxID=2036687 RepID=UPI0016752E19|nr:AAA family ATPase [Thalassotalea profundi]
MGGRSGPPCSGKSTYLKTLEHDFVISSDDVVEILCRKNGLSYHEYFQLPGENSLKTQHRHIFESLIDESLNHKHVVWDLTNLTRRSRSKIFQYYPNAKISAVVFDYKGKEALLLARNQQRFLSHGKHIDEGVMKEMFKRYEPVTKNKGYTNIINKPV